MAFRRTADKSAQMSLVPSLLQAIVGVDGEALVMHAGEKPYVVSPSGQIELASRGLTLDAVGGIVAQLLPAEALHVLDEFGAIQHELPPRPEFPSESFTVVAARGGDDVWVEIRRRQNPDDDYVPEELLAQSREGSEASRSAASPVAGFEASPTEEIFASEHAGSGAPSGDERARVLGEHLALLDLRESPSEPGHTSHAAEARGSVAAAGEPPPPPDVAFAAPSAAPVPFAAVPSAAPSASAQSYAAEAAESADAAVPAVVLPISRSPIRSDTPPPVVTGGVTGLDRLLRMAAARGASTLYLSSHARPSVRVDGEIQLFEGEPSLGPNDVESLLLTLMPERNYEALRSGMASEWISDLDGVGRVRCRTFRDHRGPGGVFRMMPVRAVTTDQLGLSRDVQALAAEPEGLVLVAGPRLSGKRTMISAFVDLINRTRRDHVITIEREINVVHDRGTSLVSQREVSGGDDDALAVARAALREDPDVLVVESLRTSALIDAALEAAASGQLVIGGFPAHSTTAAVDRIINLYPAGDRRQVQLALAENLRGIVAQVLLRKIGGGRLAAREVLLNTPAVAGVIAEGRTSQLPMAIDGGRRQGMVPLNDALIGLVQSGVVEVREAYRRAADRASFVAALKRIGMDTSAFERPA